MKFTSFHESQFRRKVDNALDSVKRLLDVNRNPRYAEEVQEHKYEDKYELAQFLTNTAIAAQVNVLERLGLDESKLRAVSDMVHQDKRSVTLRFEASDSCTFLEEKDVQVPSHEYNVEQTTKSSGLLGSRSKKETTTSKVNRKVREYHWVVGSEYKVYCFAGNDPEKNPIELQARTGSTRIITTGDKKAPIPEHTVHPPIDVPLTWLLQNVNCNEDDKKQNLCSFQIDRAKETCCTPRRNEGIESALDFFKAFHKWSNNASRHLVARVENSILGKHDPAMGTSSSTQSLGDITADRIFCPILPLMESPREIAGTAVREEHPNSILAVPSPASDPASSPLLSLGDIDKFLNEQIRGLKETTVTLKTSFPPSGAEKLITVSEATLVFLCRHARSLAESFESSIEYIEDMLRKQLASAIGKEIQPKDFDLFMQFHMNKLFADSYAPKPFCYSIRRPNHYPDGVVSIEKKLSPNDDKPEPIQTLVHCISGETAPPMYFPINAATSVEFTGPRYLHGWIQHRFASHQQRDQATLSARARQFSSFLLMVGTVAGPDKFNPKDAIIVQNKDEVIIPLLLNELPTAKEFKDAISSLSPEQQRFARSFRGMQLESSVFGVCVVQLKPQLEALLGLPHDALTKEIQLTQDLLSLFIDYQIPSDLLSYDGPDDVALGEKVNTVKGHVKAVKDVIDNAKKLQLEEATRVADMSIEKRYERMEQDDMAYDTMMECDIVAESTYGAPSTSIRRSAARSGAGQQSRRAKVPASLRFMAPPGKMAAGLQQSSAPMQTRSAHVPASFAVADLTEVFSLGSVGQAAPEQAPSFPSPAQPVKDVTITAPPGGEKGTSIDFTMIPKQLDVMFDQHDADSALRSTIIESSSPWDRTRQETLLTKAAKAALSQDDVKSEKNKAFDLLDALSRSGSLPVACAELHVVVAVTHCFENDLIGTVIQDNVNPIEKVEKSYIMMGATIHGTEGPALIRDASQTARLTSSFPALFDAPEEQEEE